jgi:hypothetical protein
MKRPFPRFEVLGLAAALAAGAACTPNNSVKPGAPVLMEMTVIEPPAPGAYGPTLTTVTAATSSCPSNTVDGQPCASASFPSCEMPTDNTLCRCIPNPAPPPPPPPADGGASDAAASDASTSDAATSSDAGSSDAGSSDAARPDGGADAAAPPPAADGTWSCSFVPTASVLYVFDRLLNPTPFDPNMGVPNVANITEDPTNARVSGLANYAANGVQNGTIFPMLGFPDGPNIAVSGSPALPAGSTVAVMLDRTKVTAKDGTPFAGTGLLIDGAIKFKTQGFVATISAPPAPMGPADAAPLDQAPDMTPATITFSNFVDPMAIETHLTVKDGGGANIPVALTSMDGLTVTVTPKSNWPASATISITLDATTPDVVGDTLGAPVSLAQPFTTSAM